MNLYATAVPSIEGKPIAFRIHAHPAWNSTNTLRAQGPGSLEGIWWQPRSGLIDILVINNSSSGEVSGTLSLFDAGGKRWSQFLTFGPHQIERIAVSDLVKKAGLSGSYGGIGLEVPNSASALDAVHLMYDQTGKFSASLEMFSRDPSATVRERTGRDQKQWTMRAPMLALLRPDPALGLSPNTKLQPTVFVRNTTARTLPAEIELSWHGDSRKGQVKLPELQLGPFATHQLQIWAMQKQLGIPDDAHWALVSLTTTGAPDDLIAIASSRDCSGLYNAETRFSGGEGGHFAGGEWRTDATHNQIAAITNVGTQPTAALLTLHYDNGEKKYEMEQTIAPGDQMWVNLAQLAQQGVPDRKGNLLPVDVSVVTYELQDQTPGGHNLMANDLAVDSASGQAVPNCPTCCGYPDYSVTFSPDQIEVLVDGLEDPLIDGTNACSGVVVDITNSFTVWNSDNASIAEVTTRKVQGVGVGATTGYAEGDVEVFGGPCGCLFEIVEPTVPINVASLTCTPSAVTRSGNVTCTVGAPPGSTFSGWTFTGSSVVTSSSTSASWSGQMVTSGTVSVAVKLSEGATMNPSAVVTVTNRSGFASASVAATQESNNFPCPGGGPTLSVPSPPSANYTESGGEVGALGNFCNVIEFEFNAAAVTDGGPNNGYKYVSSVSPTANGVNSAYYYVISPDLQNASSAFSAAQCGNYNAQTTPHGYISQPNLLANTIRHESGSVQSHYAQYVAAMNNSSNNIGTVAEQQVGLPSTSNTGFIADVTNTLTTKANTINSAAEVEPCGCNYNSTCTFQGYTNFLPYVSCN